MLARPVLLVLGAVLAGYAAARAVDRALTFDLGSKQPLEPAGRAVPDTLRHPLTLRLVDAGATGILPDTAQWGHDYSHATRAFQHLLLDAPPYIDSAAFEAVRRDWDAYLDRMVAYGSNGVVVPGVFQYVDFDRVGDGVVYERDGPARARHRVWRRWFGELFDAARRKGVRVYLATDMLVLTPELERYLRRRSGVIDTERPELWAAYAAGFAELFDSLPQVNGVVIRVGEGGALFTPPGWPYRSAFAVKTVRALRLMLQSLLPVFERRGRTLMLRTWSVGAGELGDLHTNPATYAAALGDMDSPSLIVSTKYGQGDFYGYLPANPTLRTGRQRRVIEFQARREYEGFGAFPNYTAPLQRAALAELLAANPRIEGSWLWTQEGGPLRAGPMSLYPRLGLWAWIDANAYSTARLALDPGADPAALATDWARRTFGDDSSVVRAVAWVLLESRAAVDRGLYIRPFAQRTLRAFGLEVPPLLWINEWNEVGGSSVVWSAVYRGVGAGLDSAVADGFAAARLAGAMRDTLQRVAASRRDDLLGRMRHSLDYEQSLLETLAWYRRAMLEYYRWLDTGDRHARAAWQESTRHVDALVRDHTARFDGDLDAPAFDFRAARSGLEAAERAPALAWAARLLLVLIGWALARPPRTRVPVVALLATAAVAVLSAGASPRLVMSAAVVCGAAAAGVRRAWRQLAAAEQQRAARIIHVGILAVLAVMIAPAALRGTGHFWFLIWSSSAVRTALVTAVVAASVSMVYALALVTRAALGGALIAIGIAAMAASLIAPDLATMLAALDRPLGLAPMGTSFIHGALAYFDFPRAAPWYPALAGVLLVGTGFGLRRVGPRFQADSGGAESARRPR